MTNYIEPKTNSGDHIELSLVEPKQQEQQIEANFPASVAPDNASAVSHPAVDDFVDLHGKLGKTAHDRYEDEAQAFLDAHGGRREVTAEENKRVLRKIDIYLLPIMVVIYWLQFMDKQTLSFASVFGIQTDAHLHGKQYSWLGSITYLAWYLSLPFSIWVFVRFKLSLVVPGLVVAWGTILACTAAANSFAGLLVARLALGATEACLAPSFVLMGQIWYRRSEQPLRVAIWYSQNGFVNIFGSFIAYGIGHIHSSVLKEYQIIFLMFGLITVCFGILCFFILPDNPTKNKFLTEEEKVIAVERLRANQQGVESKHFKIGQVLEMILDLKSWGWMGMMLLISIPSGGISTFGPLILSSFGFDSYQTMLLNAPFGAIQIIVIFAAFWAERRFKSKSIILWITMIPCLVGAGMLYGLGRGIKYRAPLLVAYYILSAYSCVTPLILAWQAVNTAGHTKKTATTAFTAMGQSAGNVIGPLLFQSTQAPYYHSGLRAILIIFIVFIFLLAAVDLNLWYLNKQNMKRRVAEGKPAKITDFSMLSREEAEVARAKELREAVERGEASANARLGEHAFEDLTDRKNNEFIYVY